MTKVRSRMPEKPQMIFLSALLNLGTAYNENQQTPEVCALFFDQFSETQAPKAYTAFSKKLRELIIQRTVKGILTDKKFVIGSKVKRDKTKVPLMLQDIAVFLNKALASRLQTMLDEIGEEVPFNAPMRGIKSNALSIEDLENLSLEEFEEYFTSTAETLQSRKERGEKVGAAKGKKPKAKKPAEPEEEEEEEEEIQPKGKGKKVIIEEEEEEEESDNDDDFSDLDDSDDDTDDDDDDTDDDDDNDDIPPAPPAKKPNPNRPAPKVSSKPAPKPEPEPARKKKPRDTNESVKGAASGAVKRKRPSGF